MCFETASKMLNNDHMFAKWVLYSYYFNFKYLTLDHNAKFADSVISCLVTGVVNDLVSSFVVYVRPTPGG